MVFIHVKYRAHAFKYKIRNFPAQGKIKFRILLAGCAEKGRISSRYTYNRVIWLRLSVQTIKLDLATLASAHTWRVTRRVGFRKVDRGVRRGRAARSKTPRSNSVPST